MSFRIYGFRGARPEFLLDFKKDFKDAKIISTDINYRSTEEIIKLSNAVIRQNKRRFEKNISGTGLNGKKPSVIRSNDISSEADLIAKKVKELIKTIKQEEIAVIYRTNIQSRAIIDAFMDYNISFQIKDASPSIYSHWIAKDLAAYLYLSLDKSDNLALERIINKPSRYINKIAVQNIKINCADGESVLAGLYSSPELKKYQLLKIEELIFHLNQIVKKSPYEAVKYIRKNVNYDEAIINYAEYRNINPSSFFEIINELEEASKGYETIEAFLEHMETVAAEAKENKHKSGKQYGVMLTTMHSAKGLEFDTVFIAGAVDGIIPHEKSTSEEEIEEERRLFYVGMTRAKNSLYISLLKTRYDKDVKPTRFLNGLLKKSNTK